MKVSIFCQNGKSRKKIERFKVMSLLILSVTDNKEHKSNTGTVRYKEYKFKNILVQIRITVIL